MNTTYFLNLVAGNVFGTKTTPAIPKYYIGLSTTAPNLDGTGVSEPSASAGYARIALTSLSAPNNGSVSNTAAVSFPETTAPWGTVSHYVIYDAKTGGNLLIYNALSEAKVMQTSDVLTFKAGDLVLTVKNVTA